MRGIGDVSFNEIAPQHEFCLLRLGKMFTSNGAFSTCPSSMSASGANAATFPLTEMTGWFARRSITIACRRSNRLMRWACF